MSILFSGCSHTFGADLKDPESQRYSTLVGEKLGKEVVNVAIEGASNDHITRRTLERLDESIEFVFVQFTSQDRIEFWKMQRRGWANLMPGMYRNSKSRYHDLAKHWFGHFSCPEHSSSNLWKNIYLLETTLTVPHYFFIINRGEDCNNIYKSKSSWKNILSERDLLGISLRRHPTAEEHFKLADQLVDKYKHIHYNKGVTTVTSGVTE